MKKIVVALALLVGTATFAQNKNAKASMEVDGVCLMCKDRIEKAAIKSKGVKSAIWNVDSHELKLIYDDSKTNLKTIQQSIADVGHDTKEIQATEKAYKSVHPCCYYRDATVRDEHKND